jgi:hypothetical protein
MTLKRRLTFFKWAATFVLYFTFSKLMHRLVLDKLAFGWVFLALWTLAFIPFLKFADWFIGNQAKKIETRENESVLEKLARLGK